MQRGQIGLVLGEHGRGPIGEKLDQANREDY